MRGKLMPLRAREIVPRVALPHFSLLLLLLSLLLPLLLVVLLVAVVSSIAHAGSEPTRHHGHSSLLTNCCVQVGAVGVSQVFEYDVKLAVAVVLDACTCSDRAHTRYCSVVHTVLITQRASMLQKP
jgi:hypothetical protein